MSAKSFRHGEGNENDAEHGLQSPGLSRDQPNIGDVDTSQIGAEELTSSSVRPQMPESWEAVGSLDGPLTYRHLATGIVCRQHPASMREESLRAVEDAAEYGMIPEHCDAVLENDDFIHYKSRSTCFGSSSTLTHPVATQRKVQNYLRSHDGVLHFQSWGSVWFPALGKPSPRMQEAGMRSLLDINRGPGILLVNDIEEGGVQPLLDAFRDFDPIVSFFFAKHLWRRRIHKDEDLRSHLAQIDVCIPMILGATHTGGHWYATKMDNNLTVGFWRTGTARAFEVFNQNCSVMSVIDLTPNFCESHGQLVKHVCDVLTITALALVSRVDYSRPNRREAGCATHVQDHLVCSTPIRLRTGPLRDMLKMLLELAAEDRKRFRWDRETLQKWMDHRDNTLNRLLPAFESVFPWILASHAWTKGLSLLSGKAVESTTDKFWENPKLTKVTCLITSVNLAQNFCKDYDLYVRQLKHQSERNCDYLLDQDDPSLTLETELESFHHGALELKQSFRDSQELLTAAIGIEDSDRSIKLTYLATIYLPLSLVTGVFGMNIWEINSGNPKYWVVLALGVLLLILTCLLVLLGVWRQKWEILVRRFS